MLLLLLLAALLTQLIVSCTAMRCTSIRAVDSSTNLLPMSKRDYAACRVYELVRADARPATAAVFASAAPELTVAMLQSQALAAVQLPACLLARAALSASSSR
jgi:hypothetical protein